MLNQDKIIAFLVCIILFSCQRDSQNSLGQKILNLSIAKTGQKNYWNIYRSLRDSIHWWSINKLGYYKFLGESKNGVVDSVICFNQDATRLCGCLLNQQLLKDGEMDEIVIILGEKMSDSKWYFFEDAIVTIPRTLFPGQPKGEPLSYGQLHQRAIRDVFTGPASEFGISNEAWFKNTFEGPSWGSFYSQETVDWCFKGRRYKTAKEYYEAAHLCRVRSQWMNRDTTKPVIPLPKDNS